MDRREVDYLRILSPAVFQGAVEIRQLRKMTMVLLANCMFPMLVSLIRVCKAARVLLRLS